MGKPLACLVVLVCYFVVVCFKRSAFHEVVVLYVF